MVPVQRAGRKWNVMAAYTISVGTGVRNPLTMSTLNPNVRRSA